MSIPMARSSESPPPVPPEQKAAEEAAAEYVSGTVVDRPGLKDYENPASSPRGAMPPGSQASSQGGSNG